MENQFDRKIQSYTIQLAALILIAVPVMDLISGTGGSGAVFDLPSYILLGATGLCFFFRHKSVWLLGGSLCSVFLGFNIYQVMTETESFSAMLVSYRFLDCVLIASLVAAIFHFLKYPYLDRRQHWLSPTGIRYSVRMAVTIDGVQKETLDLSYTGARIAVELGHRYQLNQRVTLQIAEIDDIQCQGKVIHVDPQDICVHFEGISNHEIELIRQWLLSQNLQKI